MISVLRLPRDSMNVLIDCLRFCAIHGRINPQELLDILNTIEHIEEIENDHL